MDFLAIKAGLDLAKALKEWAPKGRDDKALKERICMALRAFYFTPRGVIVLLRKIDADEEISREEISQALIDFNDGEPFVERASEFLSYENLEGELGISLRTIETLQAVRYGKLSLRRDIQDEINYYGMRGVRPNKDKIKTLLSSIASLNMLILETEEALGSGSRNKS